MDYSKKHKDIAPKLFKICIIQATPFILLARKQDYKIFTVTIKDIKKALKLK